ncbi:S8 family peptidase [Paenibacillus pinistramenti]|uniref:S8 family peptidase n=1 Tax=Paenibacillus pinistramenti TaxID=1768003 RepID=UPI001108C8D6|nr:S8 family peptidase [Paenibacillus pinistramenti]
MITIRKWPLLGLSAAVVTAVLLPGCGTGPSQDSTQRQGIQQQSKPGSEQHLKQNMLQRDLAATDKLTRIDAGQHMQELAERYSRNTGDAGRYVSQLQKTHKHLLSVIPYGSSGAAEARSSTFRPSPNEDKELQTYIGFAKKSLSRGKSYESPAFPQEDPHYFVMAVPGAGKRNGVIGIFSTGIMKSVENHQRRNLRLIPYPKEGKYNVESVHPDTLRDLTVKTGNDNENASHYYENEVVVTFKTPPTAADLQRIEKDIDGCKPSRILKNSYIFHAEGKSMEELTRYFRKNWKPKYVEPHYLYLTNEAAPSASASTSTSTSTSTSASPTPTTSTSTSPATSTDVPNDVLFSEYQWNLPITKTNQGWKLSTGANDVIVAVVDTGVDLDHPDLQGRLLEGYNVVNPDERPMDDVGHGTHVAGIIAANVNNHEGIAGMTWNTKILPVKALDSSGSGTTYSVAQGIIWATDHGAKVINLSLGNYAQAQFLHDAIKYAYDHDVVVIAATGNDNTERPGYPAAYQEVLSVSATDSNQKRASFSNYGDYIDVMAPGESIASTYPGNQYAALSGTSMASPHVAALAALIRSENPGLKNTEVMDLIRKNVQDLGDPGRDKYYGYGQINVYSALQAAAGTSQSEAPLQLWPQQMEEKLNQLLQKLNPNK